ncbi:MAG: hypothetical protein H6752_21835, partial [Candidatus Omnitrophica bacterium]|nr:hypothetical protein [Candidatus Omnitrophota bacterium]
CTAVIYSDFVDRFGWMKPDDPKEYDRFQMRFSRYCVMGLGIAVTLLGLLVPHLGDSLVEIVNKVVNSFTGPMLAIFLLGMFTKRANAIGVISGAVAGLLVMWVWMFATDLSFVWPPAIGFFVTAGFGYWVSLLFSPHPEGKLLWTWTNVVKGEA